jgi:hypothetical protein
MAKFILRYRGEGTKPEAAVCRIRALPELRVIDEDSPRMLLVEAPEAPLRAMVADLPDWMLSAQHAYGVPERQPTVRRPPDPQLGPGSR